jgi:NAD(P)-dependent dehydrogenase (short-subunit alcohol dehydrogenase family)
MPSYAITGASKGIGREFVRQLAQSPSNTILALVRSPSPALLALAQSHPNIHIIKNADTTDPSSVLAAAREASQILGDSSGGLDVLIHNANSVNLDTFALPPSKVPFDLEATRTFYEVPARTAIWGGAWTTNAFLPLIEKGQLKKIVHITSTMADTDFILGSGIDYALAYAIAKAGMNVQVAKYAAELAPKGIKTLSLCPGWVDTWESEQGNERSPPPPPPAYYSFQRLTWLLGPKPPQLVEAEELMLAQFRKVEPDLKGQISVQESVSQQLKVIDALDAARSGTVIKARDFKA